MQDSDKTKEQLLSEIIELRRSVAELENAEAKRKQAEKTLQESEERYRSLIESAEDSIYLVDENYRYVFINKKHLSRLGLSKEQFKGQEYSEFHSPEETKEFIKKVDRVFKIGESVQYEYKSLRDNRYFLQTFSPVSGLDGRTVSVTIISKEITERKLMEEKLRVTSLTDELTGFYNRRGFLTVVEQFLKMQKRQKRGVFLLYADIDNLKKINDEFGHEEGDRALIAAANILRENYRESDIIARIGGDEFVVIPVGFTGDGVTARLQKAVDAYNSKTDHGYKLSISTGLAYYDPERPCSIDELLSQADKRMYEQKGQKRKT
ncbi:MAG: GGDEF domain-containing protein [Nitrospirae bacterium]|nr:GGDEF domain-containing protein [Nitrospirota bacterium]